MILMQKKRKILRKKKAKLLTSEIHDFSLSTVLKSSAKFVLLYKRTFLFWCLINFSFIYLFSLIPNGWTNSLSILWLIGYYIYWCIFIRYIQQHTPYFSLIRIFNGLIPTSKIMFINISIYLVITITPYIPFFMGFRDKYLEFFEKYMEVMQSHDSLLGTSLFYLFMILISPYTISRPYLAWISSQVGRSRSIMDSYKRSRFNYWNFVCCALVTSGLFILSYYIDTIYKLNTMIYLLAILPVYFNIVFVNIYKVFYQHKAKTKATAAEILLQR